MHHFGGNVLTSFSSRAAEAAGIVLGRKGDNRQQNASGQNSAQQSKESSQRLAKGGHSAVPTPGSGGKSSADPDHVRRLKAKGRYTPY